MRFLFIVILLVFSVGSIYAQEEDIPEITLFTSDVDNVDRVQLISGNFYIKVNWEVVNRPADTAILFEQVLPDGSVVNIERPRPHTWVSSEGSGLVALHHPGDELDSLIVRISLVELASETVLVEQDLEIDITENPTRPQIDTFHGDEFVSLTQLRSGRARIQLGWYASNRVPEMSIAFEQVLPDGRIVNVELPRSNAWVNSEGSGLVAPVYPGDGILDVQLQARLYMVATGETLDTRTLFVMIQEYVQAPVPTGMASTSNISVPANIVAPSPTPQGYVPVATLTPLPTNTPPPPYNTSVPTVEYYIPPTIDPADIRLVHFTATPTSAFWGDTITVSWEVSGARGTRFWVLNSILADTPGFRPYIPPPTYVLAETHTFTAPQGASWISFTLTTDAGVHLGTLSVPLSCPPASNDC